MKLPGPSVLIPSHGLSILNFVPFTTSLFRYLTPSRSMLNWLKSLFQRKPDPAMSISVTDEGITRALGNGKVESVTWDDLAEVAIMTTSAGPFEEDVYWLLIGKSGGGCAVPQSLDPQGEILKRLQTLPGFDNEAVIQAMGSVENATFVCWKAERNEE